MRGFRRYEFQLMLLQRMADFQPQLVIEALAQLDASRQELRASHRRWQELMRSQHYPLDLRRFTIALGAADADRTIRFGDVELVARQWALPVLWPDLAWEAVTDDADNVLHEWLVRVSGSPGQLADVHAIAPWSCVVSDLAAAHPEGRQTDLQVPSRWAILVGDQLATFVWGLIQQVAPVQENGPGSDATRPRGRGSSG